MNFLLRDTRKKSKSSIAISVAIHVVLAASLGAITFTYPIAELFIRPERIKPVAVRYIPLVPKAQGAPARAPRRTPARATPPVAQLPAIASVPPVTIPAPAAPTTPAGTALGAGGASDASGRDAGIGFGLRPGIPDGRLATNPASVPRAPETEGQKAERALSAIYQVYLDSARAAAENPGRKPGDWSWGGKDGEKWGWDDKGIHVGGITIPNIVLAALPVPLTGRNMNALIDGRTDAYIRADIKMHAGLMTEDEFRAAVRRVRERVDRERRERMEKQKAKTPPCCG